MNNYNDSIDYQFQVKRFIKYLFHRWIGMPCNADKFPWLVSYIPKFNINTREIENTCGRTVRSLCVVGDVSANVEISELTNHSYFELFQKIIDYGVSLKTYKSIHYPTEADGEYIKIYSKEKSIPEIIIMMDIIGID